MKILINLLIGLLFSLSSLAAVKETICNGSWFNPRIWKYGYIPQASVHLYPIN